MFLTFFNTEGNVFVNVRLFVRVFICAFACEQNIKKSRTDIDQIFLSTVLCNLEINVYILIIIPE